MWGLIAVIFVLAICAISTAFFYNRLVRNRFLVREAFSGMDVQLKRRRDLIPNLVKTVKGYASFEKSVLEDVTRLRGQATNDSSIGSMEETETLLGAALGKLFVLVEDYPELKADSQFLDLQQQLSDVEDDLQKSRRYYNGTVRDYNIMVQSFPSMVFASLFAFRSEEFFQLDHENERAVPIVDLNH